MSSKEMSSPMARREFLRKCGALLAGGSLVAVGGVLATKASAKEGEMIPTFFINGFNLYDDIPCQCEGTEHGGREHDVSHGSHHPSVC